MEVSYGIGVKNRYALFMGDEEDETLDFISKPHKENIKSSANTNHSSNEMVVSSSKGKLSKKTTNPTEQDKIGNKDIVNGGSNVNASTSIKTKQTSGLSQKFNTNNSSISGKQQNKETMNNTSNRKGGDKLDRPRPPRQDKGNRTTNNFGNTNLESNTSQDNSWNQSESGTSAPRHQRDLEERKNRRNREDRERTDRVNSNFSEFRSDDGSRAGRGRGGGRTGFRGRGGRGRSSNFDNRGKREYDRHSGSDKSSVKPIEKRDGSGQYNWGNPADFGDQVTTTLDEIHENTGEETTTDQKEIIYDDWSAGVKDEKATEEPTEEEPQEMTYGEWKKKQEEKRILPKFNLRKPGEGEDNSHWKKTYVLKKKVDDEEEEEYEEVEEEIKHGRQKVLLDIEINFKDENRDLRRAARRGVSGRGGRGNGRGGDQRGSGSRRNAGGSGAGNFRESKEQSAPKFDDWNDFPSLATA